MGQPPGRNRNQFLGQPILSARPGDRRATDHHLDLIVEACLLERLNDLALADRSWLEAIQQTGFGSLHVSLHSLLGLCSISKL